MCTLYRTVVRGLETHLRDTHCLGKKRRDVLLEKYGILLLRPPKEVRLPEPGGPLFPSLGPPVEALLYDDCIHITTSKDRIQKYYKVHNWWFSKDDPKHWTKVKAQTFFGYIFQRYFTVVIQEHPEASPEVDTREEDEDILL